MRQPRTLAAWLLTVPPETDGLRLSAGQRPNLSKVAELGFSRDDDDGESWAESMAEELDQQLAEAEPGAPCVRVQALAGVRVVKTWTRTDDDGPAALPRSTDPTAVLVTGIRSFLDGHVGILKVYQETIERLSLSAAYAVEERDAARLAELEAHGELAQLAAGAAAGEDTDGPLKEQATELLGELVGRVRQKGPLTPDKLAEALEKNPKAAARYARNPRLREAFLRAMQGADDGA